jgi:hypothetical protein
MNAYGPIPASCKSLWAIKGMELILSLLEITKFFKPSSIGYRLT